jgi:peptidyl-prolyl cis-trans isomerase B (cyclophilin B)
MRKLFLAIALMLFGVASMAQDQKEVDYLVTVHTPYGPIKLLLFEDTPQHRDNFLTLARAGAYNHIPFHRVIDNFMIQTGDYTKRNRPLDYDPSIIKPSVEAEIRPHYAHHRGMMGAARRGNDQNPQKRSSGSQFYIIQGHKGAHHLDEEFTLFGKVMSGMRVVDSIAQVPTNSKDVPLQDVRITMEVDTVLKSEVKQFYNYQYPREGE